MCPRCSGSLAQESDRWGRYVHCLSCGYVKDDVPADWALSVQEEQLERRNGGWHNGKRTRSPQHGKLRL